MTRREFMAKAQKSHWKWANEVDHKAVVRFNNYASDRRGYGKRK